MVSASNVTGFLKKTLFSLTALATIGSIAHAQSGVPTSNANLSVKFGEHYKHDINHDITAHGDDLMGDEIDLDTGALSFFHTDLDIPGNFDIPVRFGRHISPKSEQQAWLGGWASSLPEILVRTQDSLTSGTSTPTTPPPPPPPPTGPNPTFPTGNPLPSSTGPINLVDPSNLSGDRLNFGMSGDPLSSGSPAISGQVNNAYSRKVCSNKPTGRGWDMGLHFYIDGKRKAVGKYGNPSSTAFGRSFPTPGAQTTPQYTTTDLWRIDCISRSNGRGEGFKATSPEGTTYVFDKVYGYDDGGFEVSKNYYEQANMLVFQVSKVTDKYGNSVTYRYDGNHRPTSINASDGRKMTFAYSNGKLVRVSAHGRTYNYKYVSTGALSEVILPDSRRWGLRYAKIPGGHRATRLQPRFGNYTSTIEHPDGTVGTFNTKLVMHGRTEVPLQISARYYRNCNEPGPDAPANPTSYWSHCSVGMNQKTLTLSSGEKQIWKYSYSEDKNGLGNSIGEWSQLEDFDKKTTTVVDPEGYRTEYDFVRAFSWMEGLLAETRRYANATTKTPLRTTTNEYTSFATAGYNTAESGPAFWGGASFITRVTREVVKQHGDEYYRDAEFDRMGLQTSHLRSSNRSGYGFNIKKGAKTQYSHDFRNWRIGRATKEMQVSGSQTRTVKTKSYNSKGDVKSETLFGSPNASYTYHTDGNLRTVTDALNRSVTLASYHRGHPRSVTRPDGVVLARAVDDLGQVTSVTDGLGRMTQYAYNPVGRLIIINPPGSHFHSTTIEYDNLASGGLVKTVTKGTAVSTSTYDSMLRKTLEHVTDTQYGEPTYNNFKYDRLGRRVFASQSSRSASETKGTTHTYDALGRPLDTRQNVAPFATKKERYASHHRHIVHDADGNATTSYGRPYDGPDQIEPWIIYEPDDVGRRITTKYYDEWQNVVRVRQLGKYVSAGNYSNQVNQYFVYDTRNRLCEYYTPEGGSTRMRYDDAYQLIAYSKGHSRRTSCASPTGTQRVDLSYDRMGWLTATNFTHSATPDILNSYDAAGNLTSTKRGATERTFTYNVLDKIVHDTSRLTSPTTWTLRESTTYDRNGFPSRINGISGRYYRYTHDGLGRLRKVTGDAKYDQVQQTIISDALYHPDGSVKSMRYGNGLIRTRDLNARQLTSRDRVSRSGYTAMDLAYDYTARGRVSTVVDRVNSSQNRRYGYSKLGEIVSAINGPSAVSVNSSAGGSWGDGAFDYDGAGNLTRKVMRRRIVTNTYDSRNRLASWYDTRTKKTETVEHDARGNVTKLGPMSFTYDYSDQPTRVTGGPGGNVDYLYDGNKKRVYVAPQWGNLKMNFFNVSGRLGGIYTTAGVYSDHIYANGSLIAVVDRARSGGKTRWTPTFHHNDHLGSAQVGTNVSGIAVFQEYYTPYGEVENLSSRNDDRAGFTGHIRDKATGLNYMQARYYHPVTGRFLSVDPITYFEDGRTGMHNRFSYALNNPIRYSDPNGMRPFSRRHGESQWRKFNRGMARSWESWGANVESGVSRTLGVNGDRTAFQDQLLRAANEALKDQRGVAATIAVDTVIDRGIAENSGALLAGGLQSATVRRGKGGVSSMVAVGAGNFSLQMSGRYLAASGGLFDTLEDAGVAPSSITSEALADMAILAAVDADFEYDHTTNTLTANYEIGEHTYTYKTCLTC